ncbi:hypothetical protein [Moraxella lacunata]|uniref:hypothetical protein n=1 Tax=Moraxella lacunata TaxID=477 RepID=UPI003EE04306
MKTTPQPNKHHKGDTNIKNAHALFGSPEAFLSGSLSSTFLSKLSDLSATTKARSL